MPTGFLKFVKPAGRIDCSRPVRSTGKSTCGCLSRTRISLLDTFLVRARSTANSAAEPPDAVFGSRIRRQVESTSSAVKGLPLWNVTPLRSLICHSLAFLRGCIDSARRISSDQSGRKNVSVSYSWRSRISSIRLSEVAGSSVSVVPAPGSPIRRRPPRLGVAFPAAPAEADHAGEPRGDDGRADGARAHQEISPRHLAAFPRCYLIARRASLRVHRYPFSAAISLRTMIGAR